jgi:tRNA A-37 threonylcarbamoyl transferase component Bud32
MHYVSYDCRSLHSRQLHYTDVISKTNLVQEAVAYLHAKGLVWGDAKAANVLIDDAGNAILIDFGGGFTKGWVDEVNHDTPRGDIQGLGNIIDFIKEKMSTVANA